MSTWSALKSELLFTLDLRKTRKPIPKPDDDDDLQASDDTYSIGSLPMDALDVERVIGHRDSPAATTNSVGGASDRRRRHRSERSDRKVD